jgi:hypothetical protein
MGMLPPCCSLRPAPPSMRAICGSERCPDALKTTLLCGAASLGHLHVGRGEDPGGPACSPPAERSTCTLPLNHRPWGRVHIGLSPRDSVFNRRAVALMNAHKSHAVNSSPPTGLVEPVPGARRSTTPSLPCSLRAARRGLQVRPTPTMPRDHHGVCNAVGARMSYGGVTL